MKIATLLYGYRIGSGPRWALESDEWWLPASAVVQTDPPLHPDTRVVMLKTEDTIRTATRMLMTEFEVPYAQRLPVMFLDLGFDGFPTWYLASWWFQTNSEDGVLAVDLQDSIREAETRRPDLERALGILHIEPAQKRPRWLLAAGEISRLASPPAEVLEP